MIFERDDGTALVQLAPHRLVVNKLPPYGNWQSLKSLILARLDDYDHLADAPTVIQLGLRYINRFAFLNEFRVGSYFANTPYLPDALRTSASPFLVRAEFPATASQQILLHCSTIARRVYGHAGNFTRGA